MNRLVSIYYNSSCVIILKIKRSAPTHLKYLLKNMSLNLFSFFFLLKTILSGMGNTIPGFCAWLVSYSKNFQIIIFWILWFLELIIGMQYAKIKFWKTDIKCFKFSRILHNVTKKSYLKWFIRWWVDSKINKEYLHKYCISMCKILNWASL